MKLIKLRLQKKWFEISKQLSLESQQDFLKDSLDLQKSKPGKDMLFYVSMVIIIGFVSYNGYNIISKIILIMLWTHLLYVIWVFNKKYDKFNYRWFK